jgi:hypothetical protein
MEPTWEMRYVYKIFVGELEGNRLLGRPRYRWEDNIKMYLKNRVQGCGLDRDQWWALVNVIVNLYIPKR